VVIDVHCHVVPRGFPPAPCSCTAHWPKNDPRAEDQAMVMLGDKEFRLVDHRSWDVWRRIADMDQQGVGIQVLSPMPELLSYWMPPQGCLALARHVNGAIAEMIAASPDRFSGLGMVPLQDPELAASELRAIKSEYRLCGVEIGSNINGHPPGAPQFDRFYAEAERLGLAVFVHALHPAATDRIVGHERLQALVSFPLDVGLAAASFITGGVLEKFPNLKVGFSHGGGTLCSFLPRLQSGWNKLAFINSSFASPTDVARKLYFDNIVFDQKLLRYLIDCVGVSQVFAGSDYPFQGGQEFPGKPFEALAFSEREISMLCSGNAMRFLDLSVVDTRHVERRDY
jgi:aminocarboxymuconate-semialdehyde decarboxylase